MIDLTSFFKKQRVLIALSQVALVTGSVAPNCKRTDKFGYLKLIKL